jgi:hypothetical protein
MRRKNVAHCKVNFLGARFPSGARRFLVTSGAQSVSYPVNASGGGGGGVFSRCEADHSPPSSGEVKNSRAIPCNCSTVWI